jgi:hypothetical protein
VVEVTDETDDPAFGAATCPVRRLQATVDQTRTDGGSEALPRSAGRSALSVSRARLAKTRASRRCGPATRSRSTS